MRETARRQHLSATLAYPRVRRNLPTCCEYVQQRSHLPPVARVTAAAPRRPSASVTLLTMKRLARLPGKAGPCAS